MFLKMFKHEWRATRATLAILSLAMLGLSLLATVNLRLLEASYTGGSDSPMQDMLQTTMQTLTVACTMGALVYFFAVQIILIVRFYKTRFTDEGYLTFTLPVKVRHIFLSSLVNMVIWLAISVVTILVMILMIGMIGSSKEGIVDAEAWRGLWHTVGSLWQRLFGSDQAAVLDRWQLVKWIVSPVSTLIVAMTSLTLGAVIAKKHKILVACGLFYGINVVIGSVSTSLEANAWAVAIIDLEKWMDVQIQNTVIGIVIAVVLAIGGYFLSTYMMKHKLNLP